MATASALAPRLRRSKMAVALLACACAGGQTGEPSSGGPCRAIELDSPWDDRQNGVADWLEDASRAQIAPLEWETPVELPLTLTFHSAGEACREGSMANVPVTITLSGASSEKLLVTLSTVTVGPEPTCARCYELHANAAGYAENLGLILPGITEEGVTRALALLTLELHGAPPALPTAHGQLTLRYRAPNEATERERRFAF